MEVAGHEVEVSRLGVESALHGVEVVPLGGAGDRAPAPRWYGLVQASLLLAPQRCSSAARDADSLSVSGWSILTVSLPAETNPYEG